YSPGFTNQKPNEGQLISVDISGYNPLLGESYTEMAAESRSMHKSQAMGSAKSRTARIDYLVHKAGEPATQDLFDGVDLTWKRVKGGETVEPLVQQAIGSFRADNPAASLPALATIYRALEKLDTTNPYVQEKKQDVKNLIAECAGLWFETNPVDFAATPGEATKLNVSVVNRSKTAISLVAVNMPAVKRDTTLNLNLAYNTALVLPMTVTLPANQPLTQPYWLANPKEKGLFVVNDQKLIGNAENPPLLTTDYVFTLDGLTLTYTQPWIHKYVTAEDGELYRAFEVRPVVTANLAEKVYVFADTKRTGEPDAGTAPKTVSLTLKSGRANVSGTARLQLPTGWSAEPAQIPFTLKQKFEEQTISFSVKPTTVKTAESTLRAVMTVNGQAYTQSLVTIEHPHIRPQTLFPPAEAKLVKLDIRVKAKNIGYIAGAGDEIPAALRQIGCTVTLLNEGDLQKDLSQYDAIVVGVRAYNTEDRLLMYQTKLMVYVENGGTMLVQYQTNRRLLTENMGPYPFKIT
ncbi:MAG: LmbE family protein, partial [Bacteroidetes bacterium]|nr:LmbE family protein [Fibrella sp.]